MKTQLNYLLIFFGYMMAMAFVPKTASAQQNYVNFQVFYDELSPYGDWINYPKYGFVWIPDVGPNFVPYSTKGHWLYTNYGWTWVSNYRWGWAPFHYGRWDYDDFLGWFWVPDNYWGPSWVTWVNYDGYYGWQPMQPGVSISMSFEQGYYSAYNHWTFVRYQDFGRNDIQNYSVQREEQDRLIRNARVINTTQTDRKRNTSYVSGPSRSQVQRSTGNRVRTVDIVENDRPGQEMTNGRLSIYRPEVRRSENPEQRAVPRKVYEVNDVNRTSQGRNVEQPRGANPSGTDRQDRTPNVQTPASTGNRTAPDQSGRTIQPTENNRQERPQQGGATQQNEYRQNQPTQQRSVVAPGNATQPGSTRTEPQNEYRQAQPTQQRSVSAPGNAQPANSQSGSQQNEYRQTPAGQQRNVSTPGTYTQPNSAQPTIQNDNRSVQPGQQRSVATPNTAVPTNTAKPSSPQMDSRPAQPGQQRTINATDNAKPVAPARTSETRNPQQGVKPATNVQKTTPAATVKPTSTQRSTPDKETEKEEKIRR
ncbi:MAG: DUF6600 domain-containing protein [Prolixibacteraceae bacterium]